MVKILHINTVYDRGGAAKVARFIHKNLNRTDGFSSEFAYGRGRRTAGPTTFKFSYPGEVCLNYLFSLVGGHPGRGSDLSAKNLIAYIEKQKFDIIHLHNIHGHYLNIDFINYLKTSKIRTVWTLHDGWALTGRCAYLSQCGNRWIDGCGECPDLSLYPKSFVDTTRKMWETKKEIFRDWDPLLIAPSNWLAGKIGVSHLKNKRLKVICNSVNTGIFRPQDKMQTREDLNIDRDKFVILFIAGDLNDKLKGTGYFFECLKHLDGNRMMVVTAGKTVELDEKINCDVIQLGYIDDPEILSGLYNAADIFCTTSLDEIFGLTVTESLACGTPVVGFAVGGIKEQIADDCGILVEPKDTIKLAGVINDISSRKDSMDKFKDNCRRKVMENYTDQVCFDNYLDIYKNLV
jgi:putative colanic acid biosynthesis glycosyltransferase